MTWKPAPPRFCILGRVSLASLSRLLFSLSPGFFLLIVRFIAIHAFRKVLPSTSATLLQLRLVDIDSRMADYNEKNLVVKTNSGSDENNVYDRRGSKARASFAALGNGDEKAIEGQMFSMNALDPALDAKMRLVNDVRQAQTHLILTQLMCRIGYQSDWLDTLPP